MVALFYLVVLGAMLLWVVISIALYILPTVAAMAGAVVSAAVLAAASTAGYIADSPGVILFLAAAAIGGAALARLGVWILSAVAWQRPNATPAMPAEAGSSAQLATRR